MIQHKTTEEWFKAGRAKTRSYKETIAFLDEMRLADIKHGMELAKQPIKELLETHFEVWHWNMGVLPEVYKVVDLAVINAQGDLKTVP